MNESLSNRTSYTKIASNNKSGILEGFSTQLEDDPYYKELSD